MTISGELALRENGMRCVTRRHDPPNSMTVMCLFLRAHPYNRRFLSRHIKGPLSTIAAKAALGVSLTIELTSNPNDLGDFLSHDYVVNP